MNWMQWVLRLAAAYNLLWGSFVVLLPLAFFEWAGMAAPRYPEIWQCVGMIVGVYGVGYAIASRDPERHWPLVLVGLIGKILGPLGFLQAAWNGRLPWRFGATLVFNDLVWWIPFSLILWRTWSRHDLTTNIIRSASIPPVDELLAGFRTGDGQPLNRLAATAPLLLVFLRHSGCSFCREALSDLSRMRPRIEAAGARIVLVHLGQSEVMHRLLEEYGVADIDVVDDPEKRLYRGFGLRQGSWFQLLGPHVLWRGFWAAVVKRHWVGIPDGDPFQMPGVFLVHKDRVLRGFYHRSASDRPDYEQLVKLSLRELIA